MTRLLRFFTFAIMIMVIPVSIYAADKYQSRETPETPLSTGDSLPRFSLTDTEYNSVDLYDILREEPIVLIYYRGGW